MNYEVYKQENGCWCWKASHEGQAIILGPSFHSEKACREDLKKHQCQNILNRMDRLNERMQVSAKQTLRVILIIPVMVFTFFLMFLGYEHLVKPQQSVWDEETPVHWGKELIPLQVAEGPYKEAMREAVSLWNKQAGCTLFQISKESPIIKVKQGTIEVGTETEDWGAGAFVNKETTRGKIIVYVPLMVGTDLQVLHHELGHILGLAHDTSHTMKPIIKEEIGGRQAMVRAQDKDIEALNARYCGGKKDS